MYSTEPNLFHTWYDLINFFINYKNSKIYIFWRNININVDHKYIYYKILKLTLYITLISLKILFVI